MVDDSGILSLDFIVGFTIFMISFIIVATMISGLLVGLQAKTIDYDAVAYRTGVILVEDPGYAYNPAGGPTGTNTTGWEFLDPSNKEDVKRFGLAISKDTPNILSPLKIDRFFNPYFGMSPEDYRSRLIFGDYPYRFNVTISSNTSISPYYLPNWNYSYGDIPPPEASSIRRIVKIKQPSKLERDFHYNQSTYDFSVYLNKNVLSGRPQPYQIDITKEPISIVIRNYAIPPPLPYVSIRTSPNGIELAHKTPQNLSGYLTTSLSPEDFVPFQTLSEFYITYNFTSPDPPGPEEILPYDYTGGYVSQPILDPVALVEVKVW